MQNAGEGIGTFDQNWRLSYANEALARILGQNDVATLLGSSWTELFTFADCKQQAAVLDAVCEGAGWTGRLHGRRRNGSPVPLAVTFAQVPQPEGQLLVIANVRDQSEDDVHLSLVRKLTLDAARTLEQERARMSRELHDELGQMLTAINLNLAWLTSCSEAWDRRARERLNEVQSLVDQLLETVRSLSTSLRPPVLDNKGLLEAIRSHAGKFARRAGLSCHVTADPPDLEVPDPLATTVYRIVQEALTNVARHSRASQCSIFLKHSDSFVVVKVRDNGVGAVPSRLEGVQSLGITGMRERAEATGGNLRVENRSEGGVCVTAQLPWRYKQTGQT